MPKKLDFDSAIKKVENISNKVDIIMRNGLIVAFFLIVDGITFILNPDTTLPEMAKNIILLVLLASVSVLITNLAAKTRDAKTIAISAIIVILSIVFYIYPDFIAAYIQLLLALFIIYNGAMNIINALNSDRLSKYAQVITKKYNKVVNRKAKGEKYKEQKEKFKEIDDNINQGLEEQKNKLISPLVNIVNKTSGKSSVLYIVANSASVILGIILLIFPGVSMMMWGIIFLYAGLPNLFAAIKTMDLFGKIKEKRFKEILFDAEKGDNDKQEGAGEKSDKVGKSGKSKSK